MSPDLSDIAAIATALGVLLAVYQLTLTRRDLRGTFEQHFVDRYDDIISRIDLTVMIEARPISVSDANTIRAIFDYFELCEEQLYYRSRRKVSRGTWHDWWAGMSTMLRNREVRRQLTALLRRLDEAEIKQFTRLQEALPHAADESYQPPALPLHTRLQYLFRR